MAHEEVASHADLAAELRGQSIHVPDLLGLFPNWPSRGRNKHYARLQAALNGVLDRVIPDEKRRQKFKESDFALFCSIWYPDAEWSHFYTAGLFTLWAFTWDDTIDSNEDDLARHFNAACTFRQQSLVYVKYWLGLGDDASSGSFLNSVYDMLKAVAPRPGSRPTTSPSSLDRQSTLTSSIRNWIGLNPRPAEEQPACPNDACGIFKEFGERACEVLNGDQRERFFNELRLFFRHSELEQAQRLANRVPDLDEYMNLRLGTTASRVFSCLLEIPLATSLPKWIMDSPDMATVWEETNMCIIIINDILSLKKELATDCIINAVPVMYHHGTPLSAIVPELLRRLEQSRDRLDAAAARLEAAVATEDSPDLLCEVRRYVDGCRRSDTGTIEYSILAKRYGISQYLNEDGSLDIVL